MDPLRRLWKWLRLQHPVVILRAVIVVCLNYIPYAGPRRDQERRQHVPVLIGKPEAALLLFLQDSEQRLDPIRIMKGMFLFSMEARYGLQEVPRLCDQERLQALIVLQRI